MKTILYTSLALTALIGLALVEQGQISTPPRGASQSSPSNTAATLGGRGATLSPVPAAVSTNTRSPMTMPAPARSNALTGTTRVVPRGVPPASVTATTTVDRANLTNASALARMAALTNGVATTNLTATTNAAPAPRPFPAFPPPQPEEPDTTQPSAQTATTAPRIGNQPVQTPVQAAGALAPGRGGMGPAAAAARTVPADPDNVLINFPGAPLENVLEFYANLVGRTILRSPMIQPNAPITLKSMTPLTREEAQQALDTVLALNNVTMIPVGKKFVTAVPVTQALQEGAAFSKLDAGSLPETGPFVTEIVRLTNALPSEVVPSIQPFSKIPGGIVPIDSSQVLVLRDYSANVKRMLEMVQQIDVPVESDYKLEVLPIKYGRVEDIYDVMSSLVGGGGGGGGAPRAAATRARGSRTGSSRGAGGSNTSRTSQQRQGQNQMQPGGVNPQANPTTGQSEFQRRLQAIVSRAAGGDSELLVDAKIIPDMRANSLVVYASKRDMTVVTNIISKLDIMLAQVLIEAVIVDVNLSKNMSFGISAGKNIQQSGDWSTAGAINNGPASSLKAINGDVITNVLGGFTYWARYKDDLDIVVRALAENTDATVLQRPRIQTSHAVPAYFNSGSQVAYSAGTYYGYGTGANSYAQFLDVGIMLNVTPYITPDGLVVMEVDQEISDLAGYTEISPGQKAPNTNTRSANSTVSVQDGETIILGGFIRTSKSRSHAGVPVLKDIPGLGVFFRSNAKNSDRSELLILLRPKILHTPKDASRAAQEELDSSPGIRKAKQDFETEEKRLNQEADKAEAKSKK